MPTVPSNPPSVPTGTSATEGVAAMIPVANITLEDALLDNPNFRASIKLFEGQVFFIENWLTALQRSMNQFTEEWKRADSEGLNEVTSVLNKRAEVPLLSQGMLSSQYTIPAMKLVGGAFRTTLALKNKYITEVNEQVLRPLDDFLKTDLREFKESKKIFDKALEKYESTLAKYNGQSRQKEPSALREEAFQLYDTRKAYIQATMSCAMLCIRFQDSLDQLVLGVFLDLIATQHDYFSGNADHFGSMALQVLQLKTYMKDHKEASAISLQELEQNKERYIGDAVEYWKPSRSLKCYSNAVPTTKSTIGHAALGPAFAAQMAGQVSLNTLLARPATVAPVTGGGRSPIPPQFQSQQSLISGSSAQGGSDFRHPGSRESLPATDTLTVTSALSRTKNASSSSLPNTAASYTAVDAEGDVGISTPTTKQGYLNIRIPQPKNRAPVWQRKYFFIQEGEFGFESVVSNPTVGSQVVQSERISVLLCEVRYGSSSNSLLTVGGGGNPASGSQGLAMVQMERRFCFEVVCATQSYLLQAETEEDLMSWANTFEAAKRDMLLQQHLPRHPEPEEPYSPLVPDSANASFSFSGEDLLGSHTALRSDVGAEESRFGSALSLGWAANVPGVSLLLGSYAGSTPPSSKSPTMPDPTASVQEDVADQSVDQSDSRPPSETKTGAEASKSESRPILSVDTSPKNTQLQQARDEMLAPRPLSTDRTARSRSKSVSDVVTNPEQASGRNPQISEIEKLMTSSLHLVPKATPLAVSEIPHYPMELVVRNRELHLRFHGTKVHSKEYVLHSWTSGYLDDSRPGKSIVTYGRIFLTQSGMYFYARGLSFETKRMYRFSSIRGIECEQKDISTEWRIETMDGVQHIFCQFTLTDTEYQVLHLIWTNVHQAKDRLPVRELFRRTMLITSKPKGSAGSGSLAETESSHQTTRDGTISHGGDVAESPDGTSSEDVSMNSNEDDWSDLDEEAPSTMDELSGTVSCNCPGHLEKMELEQNFKIPAKTLNRLLFGAEAPVWKEFHERRNNTVQSVGDWIETEGKKSRTVKFLMVVNNPLVKLNQTDCVETQTCEVEEEHLRYSYTVKSNVLAMPYSDAFTPVLRYCITYVNKTECKLMCSSGIEWHKNPLVKAMIKGAIIKGTAETVRDVSEIIQTHLEHRKARATGGSTREGISLDHSRTDSAKIMIALHGPDSDSHSVLHDPQAEGNNANLAVDNTRNGRTPGVRRHTVSAGTSPGKVIYSGTRAQGNWPTGAQPSFVPIGSKASRTKLLGRPSRSTILEPETLLESQSSKSKDTTFSINWLKKNLLGTFQMNDDKGRQQLSMIVLCLVLVITTLTNIWAAFNSQRMLNAAWRLQERGPIVVNGPLKGYPEPLHRVFDQASTTGYGHFGYNRNVRVAARAVYLKDLEERMLSGKLDGLGDGGQTIDRKSFEVFLDVRDSFRPWPQAPLEWYANQNSSQAEYDYPVSSSTSLASASPTAQANTSGRAFQSSEISRYPWLLARHRRWATRIIFQRDRVGILRHDLLITFEVLKQLERRLLETEYVNWIVDERSRCRLWERQSKKARIAKPRDSEALAVDDDDDNETARKENLEATEEATVETESEVESLPNAEQVLDKAEKSAGEDKQSYATKDDNTDQDNGNNKARKTRLFNAEVTKEFCQGLEHQIELFKLDKQQ
ncbi:SNF1-interacting protein [Mortierella sp. GBA30]|nr:SNF1-interacting protein [Mortierella sp. GBA30]